MGRSSLVLQVLLQTLWAPFDFSKKVLCSGSPTKATFLPSYESSIVCQVSDEQTMAGSDEDTDERTDEGKNAETIGAFNMTHKLPTHFESSTSANSMLQKHSKFNPEHCRRTVLQKRPTPRPVITNMEIVEHCFTEPFVQKSNENSAKLDRLIANDE